MTDDVLDFLKVIIFIFTSLLVINVVTTLGDTISNLNVFSISTITLAEIVIFSTIILAIYLKLKKL